MPSLIASKHAGLIGKRQPQIVRDVSICIDDICAALHAGAEEAGVADGVFLAGVARTEVVALVHHPALRDGADFDDGTRDRKPVEHRRDRLRGASFETVVHVDVAAVLLLDRPGQEAPAGGAGVFVDLLNVGVGFEGFDGCLIGAAMGLVS